MLFHVGERRGNLCSPSDPGRTAGARSSHLSLFARSRLGRRETMQSTRQYTCRAGFLAACPIERLEARRLLSLGDLEPLFGGGDAIQTTDFGATDTGRAVVVQPDGKILVAGSWDGGASEFALARYNPDGSLDSTFGGGFFGAGSGKTNAGFTGGLSGAEFATDMALQSDGKIVLVGYTNLNGAGV